MPLVKNQKLREVMRKILKGANPEELQMGKLKRDIEDELGLEAGSIDPQSNEVKALLEELLTNDEVCLHRA